MKTSSLIKWMMTGFVVIMISACSKLPQLEIDAANAAIAEATATGAEIYNLDNYLALQDSMKAVMEEIEVEQSKFFKKFGPIEAHLGQIVVMANEVKMQTEANKEEMKQEIITTLSEANRLLTENRQLVTEAPKGKEGATVLLAIKGELDAIQASINETNNMLAGENYIETLGKAKSVQQKAQLINDELTEVIARYKGKKK